jgi:hypothetical protein
MAGPMNRHPALATIGLILVLLGSPAGPVLADTSDWPSRYLAPGSAPAYVVDAAGHNHIAYAGGGIHYLTDETGTWVDVIVSSASGVLAGTREVDIDVDDEGKVYIVFGQSQYSDQPGAYYATNRSGSWGSSRLSAVATHGVAIAVDRYGEAHVVVGSGGNGVDYFTNRKGYFKRQRLTDGDSWYPNIALDANRRIHVVYEVQEDTPGIHYITNAAGHWRLERISTGTRGSDAKPSIALGRAGSVHVAYARSGPDQGLKYVTNAGGSWVTSTASTLAASEPSLTLPGGVPQIAYGGQQLTSSVHLARLSGTTWSSDRISESGWWPALAIAPGGEQRIAFDGGGVILLASNTSAPWTLTRLSSGDDRQPSLVTGSNGSMHMAWARATVSPGIYYATDRGGSWETTQLTTQTDSQPSIGLDGAGHVYIAFHRGGATWETSGVFLITNASGSWVTSRIREGSEPEEYGDTEDGCPSLAVDAAGHVQVVMSDTTTPYGFGGLVFTSAHFSNATGEWVRTEITSWNPFLKEYPGTMTLATDASSHAHVSWRNYDGSSEAQARYSTNASGSWVTTTVASGAVLDPAIALDADSSVHIAFGRGDSYGSAGVDYVTNSTGSWVRHPFSAPGSPGVGGASTARPAISVQSGEVDLALFGHGIYYATNRGGNWVAIRLSSNPADHQVGAGLSQPGLTLDSAKRVRIVFTREAEGVYLLSN